MVTERPNGPAPLPDIPGRDGRTYTRGAKNGRVAQAWEWMWDNLSVSEYTEGREVAQRASARFDLKPASLMTHLSNMVAADVLEVEYRKMPCRVVRTIHGKESAFTFQQKCAFYRIKVHS